MNCKDKVLQGQINMNRIKLAITKQALIRDKDDVLRLSQARPLRHWQPNLPDNTRFWALKHNLNNK